MRRTPLASSLAIATALLLAGCATPSTQAPAASAATAAQVPSQLPRNVRPLAYSISIIPDAATTPNDPVIAVGSIRSRVTVSIGQDPPGLIEGRLGKLWRAER